MTQNEGNFSFKDCIMSAVLSHDDIFYAASVIQNINGQLPEAVDLPKPSYLFWSTFGLCYTFKMSNFTLAHSDVTIEMLLKPIRNEEPVYVIFHGVDDPLVAAGRPDSRLPNSRFVFSPAKGKVKGVWVNELRQVKLNTKRNPCNDHDKSYKMTNCVDEFIAEKAGCNPPWTQLPINSQARSTLYGTHNI